jgi:gliding motility-associated-like protein
LEFVHTDLPSFKGCYYITAVDRSGNESDPSELACNDNCPNYVLPNIFTPNGDTFNELYNAFNDVDDPELDQSLCPRFVDKVTFTVINRNEKEVYTYVSGGENSILIGWDGKTNDGELLPAGTYYYSAEVEYDVLDPDLKKEVIKGWLDIAR